MRFCVSFHLAHYLTTALAGAEGIEWWPSRGRFPYFNLSKNTVFQCGNDSITGLMALHVGCDATLSGLFNGLLRMGIFHSFGLEIVLVFSVKDTDSLVTT